MNLEDIFGSDSNGSPSADVPSTTTSKVTAADGHEYYKSKSANATEAPTNQGTLDALDKRLADQSAGLTPYEIDFVTMCQMYYNIYGILIPEDVAVKRYGITEEMYKNGLANEKIRVALTASEIISPAVEKPEALLPRDKIITPKQMVVANTMLDLIDSRSDKKKLQDLGVSPAQYQQWLRQPAFRTYLADRAESLFDNSLHEAYMALVDRVRAGDSKAITLMLTMKGKIEAQLSNSGPVGAVYNPQVAELEQMITNLIEIIVEEVDDRGTAARIADRIKRLSTVQRLSTELTHTITRPDSVEMRGDIKEIEQRLDHSGQQTT